MIFVFFNLYSHIYVKMLLKKGGGEINMNRKTIIKIFIDIAMTVLYVMLVFAKWPGEFFHEFTGLFIGVLFIIHFTINWSMMRALIKQAAKKTITAPKLFLLVSDVFLPFGMAAVIATGILMADTLFVVNTTIDYRLLYNIHNVLSYINLGILGVHIAFHAKYLAAVIRRFRDAYNGEELMAAGKRLIMATAAACVIYGTVYTAVRMGDNAQGADYIYESNAESNSSVNKTDQKDSESGDDDKSGQSSTSSAANSSGTSAAQPDTTAAKPTLNEYLRLLTCTGCSKHCLLISPRCSVGMEQAEQAEVRYYNIYGD